MIDNSKKRSRDKSDTPPGASWVLVKLEDKINIIKSWEHETPESLPLFVMPEAIESDSYYFVAHSRKDFKIVYTDILRLESVGVDIWYDRAMEPSKDWRELAKRMMNRQECKGVIVYGTVNSMASEPVQTELLVADELGKNIIFINHGEDLKTTAAKALYEKACKKAEETRGADCAREEPTEEDRKRVERFEELLARKGNPNITYIGLDLSPDAKKDKLDKIKPEEVLIYAHWVDLSSVVGVKYLGVKSVKIPEEVTIDGNECEVTEIGACAFANCRALEKIELPKRLKYIGEHAFFGCESLTKMHLGEEVWLVAEDAFENCENLEEVTVAEGNEDIIVKDSVHYTRQLYGGEFGMFFVPRDLKGAITLLDELKAIKPYAFVGRDGITAVAIPDSVTSIGDSAFRGCTSLASVTIGNGVASIGSTAFCRCTSLTSLTIPVSVERLGFGVFRRCASLKSINYTGTVKQWIELIAERRFWARYSSCEVVKCKDGDAPVTARDRGE